MKKVYLVAILSSLLMSCSAYKPLLNEDNIIKKSNIQQTNNVEIIPLIEMGDIPEFSMFIPDTIFQANKENIRISFDIEREKIKSINFVEISKWAKSEMNNYKLKDESFNNFSIENTYSNKSNKLVKIKLDSLPSHSPLVIRNLYTYNLYDNNDILKKIYVIIEGHVEE